MSDVVWSKKFGTLFLLLFSMMFMVYVMPNSDIVGILTFWDLVFMFVILVVVIYFGAWSFFIISSPAIVSETSRSSSDTGRVFSVTPDDDRLPHMLAIPYGGYVSQAAWMTSEDIQRGGGVLFSPSYLVERMGPTLLLHGRPIRLSSEAVENNTWMEKELNKFDNYVSGKSNVYMVISGSGPPLDSFVPPEERYHQQTVLALQEDMNRKVISLAEKSISDVARRFRIIQDAWVQERAESVLTKQEEIKGRDKDEGEQR